MANHVLNEILEEEKKAAEELREAQQSANELVKNAEAQATEAERKAAVEHRALYQKILDDRRLEVESRLRENVGAQPDHVLVALNAARDKMPKAVDAIVDGVLNGHR